MGSLPNLHELGKDPNVGFKGGPALGHLCGGTGDGLTVEEKNRILHRHSGHAKVTKVRSNGHDPYRVDDLTLEHMAAYSPISNKSRNFQQVRRKDSLSSSIGATSVRRLLAVVRTGSSHGGGGGDAGKNTPLTRSTLIANLIVLCISHTMITAAYLPYLALQSSLSVWSRSDEYLPIDINVGSILLAAAHIVAGLSSFLSPPLIHLLGNNVILIVSYLTMGAYFASHLYPALYVLIPSTLVFGFILGIMTNSQTTFLIAMGLKLTGLYGIGDEEDEMKNLRKTCIVRRIARAFRGAYDIGLMVGSIVSAVIITYTVNRGYPAFGNQTQLFEANGTDISFSPTLIDYNTFLDGIFDTLEETRLCGAQACPSKFSLNHNESSLDEQLRVLPVFTSEVLAGVYAGLCFVATILIVLGLDRVRLYTYQDPLERNMLMSTFRGIKEICRDSRLQLAAPLAFFIGLEQAFMFADFSKSYVVCTIGIHRLNLVFLSMGLLQSIAACTLSMLLRSIRRCYVIAVGFTFHSCLLMVQMLWKPIEDDPALFYVISASWGVCNAIWEIIAFTLITSLYIDKWDSAFAVMSSFRFLGFGVAFFFHGFACNYVKLYALAFAMVTSVVAFAYLEVKLESAKKLKNISRL